MELAIWTHRTIITQGKSFWSRDHNPAMKLIFLSVVIHLILFFSIFDIYFRSPVEPVSYTHLTLPTNREV